MTKTNKLPAQFKTWLEFYDYLIKSDFDNVWDKFKTVVKIKLIEDKSLYLIHVDYLKARCFDEINKNRITIEENPFIIDILKQFYYRFDLGKIEKLLNQIAKK